MAIPVLSLERLCKIERLVIVVGARCASDQGLLREQLRFGGFFQKPFNSVCFARASLELLQNVDVTSGVTNRRI